MARLEQRSFIGGFGSLDNGVAEPAATPDALITAFEIEHDRQGSIKQRPGHIRVAGLDSWTGLEKPLTCGVSVGGTELHVRVTYVTAAGETDDLHSAATFDGGTDVASISVNVPFTAKRVKPIRHDVESNTIFFDEDFPFSESGSDTASFDGFHVFSRGPFLQDETRLGANPNLVPLYNRTKPMAKVAAGGWTLASKSLVLDRPIPDLFGPGMSEADRTLDLLFPDSTGLPVLWWNMYLSSDGTNFYYHRSGTSAESGVIVRPSDVDTGATKAPSIRITRTAPTVAVADATRTVPETGATVTAKTGLGGGCYRAWYCWETGRDEYVDAPGWSTMKSRLGFIGPERIPRGKQLTWPSAGVTFSLSEDQQFTVTLPTFPSGVETAQVYVEQVRADDNATASLDEVVDYVGATGETGSRIYTPGIFEIPWVPETEPLSTASAGYWTPSNFRTGGIGGLAGEVIDPPTPFEAEGGTTFNYAGKGGGRVQLEVEIDPSITSALQTVALELKIRRTVAPNAVYPDWDSDVAGANGDIHISVWDDGGAAWTSVRVLSIKDDLTTDWQIITIAADYVANMEETDGGVDRIVWAVEMVDGPDVEIDFARHFHYHASVSSDIVRPHAFLQRKGVTDTAVVFDKPITNRAGLAVKPDTTGQWPCTLHSTDQIGDAGGEEFKSDLIVAAADSVFVERAGQLIRVYREEGQEWTKVMENDWRFANYLNRTFIYNAGRSTGNLMFDGFATQKMGLDNPLELQGSAIPLVAEEALEGTGYNGEYFIQYVREMTTFGRTYIKVSKAVQFTDTFQFDEHENLTSRYRVIGPGPTDPQVTHVRVYRTKKGTGKAFLTRVVPLIQSSLSESFFTEDGQFVLDMIDDVDDDTLGREADFDTGPAPAARLIEQHGEHLFLVPQSDGELAYFSRLTPDASADPEGFDPSSFVDVKTRRASTISALSSYGSALLLHTDNGISAVTGTAPNLAVNQLFADAGAIGPKAWANVDNAQWVMTRRGPCIIYGSDLRLASFKVEGSIKNANFDVDAAKRCNALLYRAKGRTQLWFTYATNPSENPNRVLVNDLNVGPGTGEDRELWAEWKTLAPYDTVVTDDYSGNEIVIMSDLTGDIHRHDADITDNGLPIEADWSTKPVDISGRGISFRPRMVVFKTNGSKGHFVTLEVKKDYQKTALHPRKFMLDMGTFSAAIWGKFVYGDGTQYGDTTSDALQNSLRVHLGRPMQQIQMQFSTKWDDMPPGTPRDNAFEITGYEIHYRPLSLTRARVLS